MNHTVADPVDRPEIGQDLLDCFGVIVHGAARRSYAFNGAFHDDVFIAYTGLDELVFQGRAARVQD
ncbi:MAG: hypothetical protein QM757_20315 [Paludibaculum sp.]